MPDMPSGCSVVAVLVPGQAPASGFAPSPFPSFVATLIFFQRKHKYLISLRYQIFEKWANL